MKKFIISIFIFFMVFLSNSFGAFATKFSFDDYIKMGNKVYISKEIEFFGPLIREFMAGVKKSYKIKSGVHMNLQSDKLNKIIFSPKGMYHFARFYMEDEDCVKKFNGLLYVRREGVGYSIVLNMAYFGATDGIEKTKEFLITAYDNIMAEDFN